MRYWKWRRRQQARVLAVASAIAAMASCGQPTGAPTNLGSQPSPGPTIPPPAAPGKLLYASEDGFWTFEPRTNAKQQLLAFPADNYADAPATSPDGTRIAYSVSRLGKTQDDSTVGTDLYMMNVDGTNQQLVLSHQEPGEWLSEPAWMPDGQTLYFTRRSPERGQSIQQIRLGESEPTSVIKNGESPALSADGTQFAYVTFDQPNYQFALWVAQPDGTQARQVVPYGQFDELHAPRFSPDGRRIAFGATGGPRAPLPGESGDAHHSPQGWLRPREAQAHNIPWDLWVINSDGTGLQQLSNQGGAKPRPAWSRDGRWIAFQGELGLDLFDVERKKLWHLTQDMIGDGLTWLGP